MRTIAQDKPGVRQSDKRDHNYSYRSRQKVYDDILRESKNKNSKGVHKFGGYKW